MSLPLFGRPRRRPTLDRPAAYALLATDDGVAVVLTDEGELFLPGGGLLDGETPEDAVVREVMEECGLHVVCDARWAEAIQHFTARDGRRDYRSHMVFIECRLAATGRAPGEHPTLWLTEMPARRRFVHEAHAWVLQDYLASRL